MTADLGMLGHPWVDEGTVLSDDGELTVWSRAGRYFQITGDGPPRDWEGGFTNLDALLEALGCRRPPAP